MLFLVQGCGQNGLSRNWGDGLATNYTVIEEYGISDPNPFFKELLQRPYLDNIILSPHVYPPSVYDTLNNMTEGANVWPPFDVQQICACVYQVSY